MIAAILLVQHLVDCPDPSGENGYAYVCEEAMDEIGAHLDIAQFPELFDIIEQDAAEAARNPE
jgi:hypothetical protein